MTTTQTGGGNGAAPDGEPGRIVPDAPGWWIGQRHATAPRNTDNPEPHPIAVSLRLGKLCAGSTPVDDQRWTWFCRVPSTAVCAALAEYMRADADWDTFRTTACRDIREDAHLALQAAIRAERGGDATCPICHGTGRGKGSDEYGWHKCEGCAERDGAA